MFLLETGAARRRRIVPYRVSKPALQRLHTHNLVSGRTHGVGGAGQTDTPPRPEERRAAGYYARRGQEGREP